MVYLERGRKGKRARERGKRERKVMIYLERERGRKGKRAKEREDGRERERERAR